MSDRKDEGTGKRYATERVIIVIIDGLRNEEAFDDPTHQYIPHIWNELRPQGTIYTEMYTLVQPITTPGHLSIITGARNNLPNTKGDVCDNFRETRPTLFECYRKQKNLPPSETWIVSGKDNLSTCDYSLHPFWGSDYAAMIEFGTGKDVQTMQIAFDRLDDQPSLFLINLEDVDRIGHGGIFEYYTAAIEIADGLVSKLWQEIQSRPDYRDKTALIVTTDHGRNEESFHNHGNPTHSNRHVMFLALGPDFKKDAEITARADLIDITSTVAELLGFDMPYAKGRILHEMFIDFSASKNASIQGPDRSTALNLSDSAAASRDPSITADADGLHVVWSERDTTRIEEARLIKYRSSHDFGSAWIPGETLVQGFNYYNSGYIPPEAKKLPGDLLEDLDLAPQFVQEGEAFGGVSGTPIYATIHAGPDRMLFLAVAGYAELNDSAREFFWGINILQRDFQGQWRERGFENRGQLTVTPPALCAWQPESGGSEAWAGWTEAFSPLCLGRSNAGGGIHFDQKVLFPAIELKNSPWSKGPTERGLFRNPATVVQNGFLHLVYGFLQTDSGDIYYSKFEASSCQMVRETILDSFHHPSFDPKIAAYNDKIYVLWADYIQREWKIRMRISENGGASFGTQQELNTQSGNGWHPDFTVDGNRIMVVWEDYSQQKAEIRTRFSSDGGRNWGEETTISSSDDPAVYPRIALGDGAFHAVWQVYSGGTWDIYYRRLDP